MQTRTKKLILIVEDEKAIALALAQKFSLVREFDFINAFDGEAGLKKAVEKEPDLILLDIILPKMDGIEMLKRLRQDEKGKNIKVIILSNLSNPDKEREAKELGVTDYIIKADWRIDDIVALIERKLAQ